MRINKRVAFESDGGEKTMNQLNERGGEEIFAHVPDVIHIWLRYVSLFPLDSAPLSLRLHRDSDAPIPVTGDRDN